jgi:hypothetical protein
MIKVGPETSPAACTWPVQLIYMSKKVGPETFYIASKWPADPIYMTKKFGPEISPAASTLPVHPMSINTDQDLNSNLTKDYYLLECVVM